MRWYNYLGWVLVGIFILFFGVGTFAGIDESQAIIPILVILALAAGFILVNKYEQRGLTVSRTRMEQLCIVIEYHWTTALALCIALLMIIDACTGNEPDPRFPRLKKRLMMIALARISFCLTDLVWR